MNLTAQQIRQFEEQGYLFLPQHFSMAEIAILNAEVPGILTGR